MGDVIVLAVVVVGVAGGIAFVANWFANARRQTAIGRMPTRLLPPGEDSLVYLERAKQNLQLAQRAVRLFERQLERDDNLPFLSPPERDEMRAIVQKFYEQEG